MQEPGTGLATVASLPAPAGLYHEVCCSSLEPSTALGTRGEAAMEGEQWSHTAGEETGLGEGVWDMQ